MTGDHNFLDPKHHPWMRTRATRRVMEVLNNLSQDCARFVGGCVRDSLMGHPVKDIDIATSLTPDEVMRAAQQAGLKTYPTGLQHGTVTVVACGTGFEVTTLRRDVRTDGRHAQIALTQDWDLDSQRRDFRLNAIYAFQDGRLYDPQGGLDDALRGRVRFIGDPDARLREDYLRLLRFFRFHARYGQGAPDEEGLRACLAAREGLKQLSQERVYSELQKLLSSPDPRQSLHIMQTTGLWHDLVPEADREDRIEALISLDQKEQAEPDPLLRLMAMTACRPATVRALGIRLKTSKTEQDRLDKWADPHLILKAQDDKQTVKKALYYFGAQAVADRARLSRLPEKQDVPLWQDLEQLALNWTSPTFPLKGRHLVDAGVEPGPDLGQALKKTEEYWVETGFSLTREALIRYALTQVLP